MIIIIDSPQVPPKWKYWIGTETSQLAVNDGSLEARHAPNTKRVRVFPRSGGTRGQNSRKKSGQVGRQQRRQREAVFPLASLKIGIVSLLESLRRQTWACL